MNLLSHLSYGISAQWQFSRILIYIILQQRLGLGNKRVRDNHQLLFYLNFIRKAYSALLQLIPKYKIFEHHLIDFACVIHIKYDRCCISSRMA